MSLFDSLRHSLDTMDFLQLCLAFAALLAYAISLSPSFGLLARAGGLLTALFSAAGFAAASPQWAAGVVLMALGVAAFGLFAGASWLLSRLLGLGDTRGRLAADMPFAHDPAPSGPRAPRPAGLAGLHRPSTVPATTS